MQKEQDKRTHRHSQTNEHKPQHNEQRKHKQDKSPVFQTNADNTEQISKRLRFGCLAISELNLRPYSLHCLVAIHSKNKEMRNCDK